MIGVDTNLLVRLVTNDDPVQAAAVERFLDEHCTIAAPGFINRVVLCELTWVLRQRYKYGRRDVLEVVSALYHTPALLLKDADIIPEALRLYSKSSADLSDILIGLTNQKAGCDKTVTLDKAATALEQFIAMAT